MILANRNSKHKRTFVVCLDGVKRACGVVDWHLMAFIMGDFPQWDENFHIMNVEEYALLDEL